MSYQMNVSQYAERDLMNEIWTYLEYNGWEDVYVW